MLKKFKSLPNAIKTLFGIILVAEIVLLGGLVYVLVGYKDQEIQGQAQIERLEHELQEVKTLLTISQGEN